MEKIEEKEKEITTLRVKYDREKNLLSRHGIASSNILGGVSLLGVSGNNHRVKQKIGDTASSGSNAH